MDPLQTETAEFWKPHGDFHKVDPTQIQTEVFRLPTTCFAEERGSLVSSSRVLQWHWQGAEGPGQAERSGNHVRPVPAHEEGYQTDGGKFPTRS
jgi:formate dehydrogenase major subunit